MRATEDEHSPVEVIFSPDPTAMALCSDGQQVEQPHEAEDQAEEEQLPGGRRQQPRDHLGRQAEMPRGWQKARNADPVSRAQEVGKSPVRAEHMLLCGMRESAWGSGPNLLPMMPRVTRRFGSYQRGRSAPARSSPSQEKR